MSSDAGFHHLIPLTYLRSWSHSGDGIYSYTKNNLSKMKILNINNHFGIQHYHSIRVGMHFLNSDELCKIFEPLKNYRVEYEGLVLTSLEDYNKNFYDIQNWIVYYPNGKVVPKKRRNEIYTKIKQINLLDIENGWNAKYENKWPHLLKIIEQKTSHLDYTGKIESFYKGAIMKFIVSLGWRSNASNEVFIEMLNYIDDLVNLRTELPEEDRLIPTDRTVYEMIKRQLLLKTFQEFLNNTGHIYEMALQNITSCTIKFLIATGEKLFLTSDNPSFTHDGLNGKMPMMAITPRILALIGKDDENSFHVSIASDEDIKQLNRIIIENADKIIISKNNLIDI